MVSLGRTRWSRAVIVTTAVALLSLSTPAGATDVGASSLSLVHVPPATAVAGDALVLGAEVVSSCAIGSSCSSVALTAHYRDAEGLERQAVALGSPASRQYLSVSIPGVDVRFPACRTRWRRPS